MAAKRSVTKVRPAAITSRERRFRAESAWRLLPRNPTILAQLPTKSSKCRRNNANWQRKQVCALSVMQKPSLQAIMCQQLTKGLEVALIWVLTGETARGAVVFRSSIGIIFVSLELPCHGPVSVRFLWVSQVETISCLKRKTS